MKIKSACLEFGRLWRVFAPMFVSKLHCWCIFLSRVRRCEHNWKCFGKSSDAKSIFVFDKKRTGRPDVHITFAGCQFGWAAELYRPGLTMQFQWEATKKDSNYKKILLDRLILGETAVWNSISFECSLAMAHIVHWMGLRTLRIRLYNAMSMRSVALQNHTLLFFSQTEC